jgi:hypothetical protein
LKKERFKTRNRDGRIKARFEHAAPKNANAQAIAKEYLAMTMKKLNQYDILA